MLTGKVIDFFGKKLLRITRIPNPKSFQKNIKNTNLIEKITFCFLFCEIFALKINALLHANKPVNRIFIPLQSRYLKKFGILQRPLQVS